MANYAERLRSIAKMNKDRRDRAKDPEDAGLIIRESLAHRKRVDKLNPHGYDGLLSISKDCQVRVWSKSLDLWGIIDCRHYEQDVLWYFPRKLERQN